MNVVIIGAGVSGLYSALELEKEGHDVTVIEKKEEIGGMSRSVIFDSFVFDYGSHVIHTDNPSHKEFISTLLGNDLLQKNIIAKSYFNDQYHNFPPIMEDILELPFNKKIRVFVDILKGYFNRFRPKKLNFEEQLRSLSGEYLYKTYFEGYTTKFWGVSPTLLSSKWVPKRVIPRFRGHSALANEWQAYPKYGGIGTIPSRMVSLIKKGTIHTGSEVVDIIYNNEKVIEVIVETNRKRRTIECDGIISTIPLPMFLNSFGIKSDVQYRSMIFMFLKLKRSEILQDCTIAFFPSQDIHFSRIFEPNKYSKHCSPDGYSSLGVEIPCSYNDDMWMKSDQEIADETIESLVQCNIIEKNDVSGYKICREQWAYPIPTISYYEEIDKLRNSINKNNVFLAGRMGYFEYMDMCNAMESGGNAAKQFNQMINR